MLKIILLFLGVTALLSSYPQVDKGKISLEKEITFEISDFVDCEYKLLKLEDNSFIFMENSYKCNGSEKGWILRHYDNQLNELEQIEVGLNAHMFLNSAIIEDTLFLFMERRPATVLKVNTEQSEFVVCAIQLNSFELISSVRGGASQGKWDLYFDLQITDQYYFVLGQNLFYKVNRKTKEQTKFQPEEIEKMIGLYVDNRSKKCYILNSKDLGGKKREIGLLIYDYEGKLIKASSPVTTNEEILMHDMHFAKHQEQFILYGSYHNLESKKIDHNWAESLESRRAEGFFISHIKNDDIAETKFFPFRELDHFYDHLSEKEKSKVAKKQEKNIYTYSAVHHNLIKNGDDTYMVIEIFAPHYEASGSSKPGVSLKGYDYTQVLLMKLDEKLTPKWDQNFRVSIAGSDRKSLKGYSQLTFENTTNQVRIDFGGKYFSESMKISSNGKIIELPKIYFTMGASEIESKDFNHYMTYIGNEYYVFSGLGKLKEKDKDNQKVIYLRSYK